MEKTIQQWKREFLEYVEIEKGQSLKTVANYGRYLDRFFKEERIGSLRDITDDSVRSFRLKLNRAPGAKVKGQAQTSLKKNTQNYHLIAIRVFLKYLMKRGENALSPDRIELAKIAPRHLDLITTKELERLMAAPRTVRKNSQESSNEIKKSPSDTLRNTLIELRDSALLELFFSTGLRLAELCSLNADLDLTRDEFSIRGKGEKVRVVFLSESAKNAIRAYLAKRADMKEPLFLQHSYHSTTEGRLTPRSIERIVKHYAVASGISKKVTPHILRHGFATDLLSNGADIRSVQMMLGHANIATTQVYTHITDKQLRDVHKKFHSRK